MRGARRAGDQHQHGFLAKIWIHRVSNRGARDVRDKPRQDGRRRAADEHRAAQGVRRTPAGV